MKPISRLLIMLLTLLPLFGFAQNSSFVTAASYQAKFTNRFFITCGKNLFGYVSKTPMLNYALSLETRDKSYSQKWDLPNLIEVTGIQFSPDCQSVILQKKDQTTTAFPLTLGSFVPAPDEMPSGEAYKIEKRLSLDFGEKRIVLSDKGRTFIPDLKLIGRQNALSVTTAGMYLFNENLTEQKIYYYDFQNKSLQALTNFKPEVSAQIQRQQFAATDGTLLPAFLARAQNSQGVVIAVHGGGCWLKESAMDISFYSYEYSDILRQGYDILMISYSGDKDIHFTSATPAPCGSETKDLLSAYQFAQEKLRPQKTFFVGESYGAYLINLFIGKHPEVALNGVISKYGIWDTLRQKQFLGSNNPFNAHVFEDPRPLISQIKSPILLLHGQKDDAVSFANATFFISESQRLGLKSQVFTPVETRHGFDYDVLIDLKTKEIWHQKLADFLKSH